MKKILAVLLLAAVLLAAAAPSLADGFAVAESVDLPESIRTHLGKQPLSGYTVTAFLEHGGFAFAALQSGSGENLLWVYQQKNGAWAYRFKTGKAIPRGKGRITLEKDWNSDGFVVIQNCEQPYDQPGDVHSWEKRAYYVPQDSGAWRLAAWRDEVQWVTVEISGNRIAYYGGQDAEEYIGSAYGVIQADLRYVNLSAIPATLKEARKKYTLAPSLPAGSLSAQVIQFTGGKKYEVYSGPGENYLRGANGKAGVSTNDWIQVFGEENGWIMIQYAIDSAHYRIGYIPAKALPKKAEAAPLSLDRGDVRHTVQAAGLTDDPLFSGETLAALPEGAEVTFLGTLGDFAYVEAEAGAAPVRGFVPESVLSAPVPGAEGDKF